MDAKHRKELGGLIKKRRARKETGLYIIDGPRTAAETDKSIIEEIFVTEEFLKSPYAVKCGKILEKGYSVISESEMEQISDTVTPQGILIVARQKIYDGVDGFAAAERSYAGKNFLGPPLLLLLETIQDPGNLGTIIRMAEAAGVTGIISDTNTADLYSPKVVRSTMGAVMRLPYITVDDIAGLASWLSDGSIGAWGHIWTAAAALSKDAVEYTEADYTLPAAIMIGNEARGLSRSLIEAAGTLVMIPMHGSTESLNAAVAASVIAFEAARQRRNVLYRVQ